MKINVTLWPGIKAKVTKTSKNPGYMSKGESMVGQVITIPTIGMRFRMSGYGRNSLDTNIVAKIVKHNESGGEFETLTGSTYSWVIVGEEGNPDKKVVEVEIPENVVNLIETYNYGRE